MMRVRNSLILIKDTYSNYTQKFGEGSFLGYAVAIVPRLLFLFHAVFSVRLLEKYIKYEDIRVNDDVRTFATQVPTSPLYTGLTLLAFESLYTIVARKGHEYKHIWYSGFLYMVTEIPVICCLEYAFYQKRKIYADLTTVSNSTSTDLIITRAPYNPDTYVNCFHLSIHANCSDQFIRKFAELGLISVIIIGRWMLPRGELTRDQLSALLIGYVNTAADLTEFVGLLTKTQINKEKTVMIVVLAVYSLSLLQFAIVTTSTTYEYSEIEKEAISNLTKNLPQARVQGYLQPRDVKMRQSELSRSVDTLAKDVFRSGERAGRRRRAILPERNIKVSPVSNGKISKAPLTGSGNLANETIYEESDSSGSSEKQTNKIVAGNNEDTKEVYYKDRPSTVDGKNNNNNNNGSNHRGNRKEALVKWQSEPKLSARMESVRKSVTEENWKELSEALSAMKQRRIRDKDMEAESLLDEKLKDYPIEILRQGDGEEISEESSWNKWIEVVQTEMGGLLIALFLQEIPFFFTRVAFMYKYELFDRGLIFYTIKNFFMLSFLNYRLWVATTDG